jgi:hypothetical protein
MSIGKKLFWLVIFFCLALLALNHVADVVHVTIEFGRKPTEVIRVEMPELLPAPTRRPSAFLRAFVVSHAVHTSAACGSSLIIRAPRSNFLSTHAKTQRPVVVHTVIRDGRERGSREASGG